MSVRKSNVHALTLCCSVSLLSPVLSRLTGLAWTRIVACLPSCLPLCVHVLFLHHHHHHLFVAPLI